MERFDLLLNNFETLNNELKIVVGQLRKENNDVFNAIVENSPNFVAIVQDGKYVFINSCGLRMLHCRSSAEIIGKDFKETIAPESYETVIKRLSTAHQAANKPAVIKIRCIDETYFYSESNSVPFTYNKQPAVLIIGRDVTAELQQKSIVRHEEKLRTDILNSFKEVVAFYNPNHQIVWINDAGKKQLNISDDSYMGKACHKVWFNSKVPCPTCPMVHNRYEVKERIVTFPDNTIWKIKHTPLFTEDGIISGYIEYREDITEKEMIKMELEKSHSRLENAELANAFGHFEYNITNGERLFSKGIYQILDLPVEPILNTEENFYKYIHPDDLDLVASKFKLAVSGKENLDQVFRLIDAKGVEKTLRGIGQLNVSKGKKKFFGVIQDITSIIKLQKQVLDEREKFRMLADNAPFGLLLSKKGVPIFVNNTLLKWLNINSISDFSSINILNFFYPADRKLTQEIITGIEQHNIDSFRVHNFKILSNDNTDKYIRIDIKRYLINNQEYVQTVIADITSDVLKDKKQKQVAADALYINQKNSILAEIESELDKVFSIHPKYNQKDFVKIFDIMGSYKQLDKDWNMLVSHFNEVHPGFFERLKEVHPNLSTNDIKHCACIKMNFDTKQIARFFNIKAVSVQIWRVRLKKKMNLSKNDDLRNYILYL
jgi:PAS domain S-box-containing protein